MREDDELEAARNLLRERLRGILGEGAPEVPRLDEALTHPSYANETGVGDNQRLEFLGDAVLSLCVSELLGNDFPEANEGLLTRMRSALVNAEALAGWARAENLGASIALGRGARSGAERNQTNVLADAVEAVVAAVYHAHGLDGARALVRAVVAPRMREEVELASRDPKSELQERVQALGQEAPRYRVRASRGPDHDAIFEVEVTVGTRVLGNGEGRSKRLAERRAAEDALKLDLVAALKEEPGEAQGSGLKAPVKE